MKLQLFLEVPSASVCFALRVMWGIALPRLSTVEHTKLRSTSERRIVAKARFLYTVVHSRDMPG